MRCAAIYIFKQPDKMKLGKVGFIGDVIEVDIFGIIIINKKLCLNDALV